MNCVTFQSKSWINRNHQCSFSVWNNIFRGTFEFSCSVLFFHLSLRSFALQDLFKFCHPRDMVGGIHRWKYIIIYICIEYREFRIVPSYGCCFRLVCIVLLIWKWYPLSIVKCMADRAATVARGFSCRYTIIGITLNSSRLCAFFSYSLAEKRTDDEKIRKSWMWTNVENTILFSYLCVVGQTQRIFSR